MSSLVSSFLCSDWEQVTWQVSPLLVVCVIMGSIETPQNFPAQLSKSVLGIVGAFRGGGGTSFGESIVHSSASSKTSKVLVEYCIKVLPVTRSASPKTVLASISPLSLWILTIQPAVISFFPLLTRFKVYSCPGSGRVFRVAVLIVNSTSLVHDIVASFWQLCS